MMAFRYDSTWIHWLYLIVRVPGLAEYTVQSLLSLKLKKNSIENYSWSLFVCVCFSVGCLSRLRLWCTNQRNLSRIRPNWPIFQHTIQTGETLPHGWFKPTINREIWDINVSLCLWPFVLFVLQRVKPQLLQHRLPCTC